MSAVAEEAGLVGEYWQPSGVDDAGAAELAARIDAAPPVRLERGALDGRCGLASSELWRLGVRTAPTGALSRGWGAVLRVVVVAACVGLAFLVLCVLVAVSDGSVASDRADSTMGQASGVALMAFFLVGAYGCWMLARWAGGRERERRLSHRRAARAPVAPAQDPHGRLTVAVLDGPGVLRVLLLWVRGDAEDPELLEARVVAERRVPRDEPGRAEDAVAALSETAALAGERVPGSAPAARPARASAASRTSPAPPFDVDDHWQPDGTTEEGEAELARRLLAARPVSWDAELLAPLVVDDVRSVPDEAPRVPPRTTRRRARPRPALVRLSAGLVLAFGAAIVVSRADGEYDLSTEITARVFVMAVLLGVAWAAFGPQLRELPSLLRRRHLLRLVDDAAVDVTAPLEGGLPGGHGQALVVVTQEDGRRVVRLAHVRRVADGPEGRLELRALARRRLDDHEELREVVQRFLLVADDEAFTSRRGLQSVTALRRLSRRLGVTTTARGRRLGPLGREPVAWLGALSGVGALVVLVLTAVVGVREPTDALVVAVMLAVACGALIACARGWTRDATAGSPG